MQTLVAIALATMLPTAGWASQTEQPARFDLAALTVNGRTVLGKPIPSVTAVFGKPTTVTRFKYATYLRYGPKRTYRVLVGFRAHRGRLLATSLRFQSPQLVERRLGRVLALRPEAIQSRVQAVYADTFRLAYEYQCLKGACEGSFSTLRGRGGFGFGIAGGRSFIRITS